MAKQKRNPLIFEVVSALKARLLKSSSITTSPNLSIKEFGSLCNFFPYWCNSIRCKKICLLWSMPWEWWRTWWQGDNRVKLEFIKFSMIFWYFKLWNIKKYELLLLLLLCFALAFHLMWKMQYFLVNRKILNPKIKK